MRSTEARSELYQSLATLCSFPTEALAADLADGSAARAIGSLVAALPYRLDQLSPGLEQPALTYLDLQSEYIRLFDLPGGARAPLYTGVVSRSRREAMEELLRFYRHFGLTLAEGSHDLPDAVPTVLEFLQFLVFLEGEAEGQDAEPARRAQRDLLTRHVVPWADHAAGRVAAHAELPVYAAVTGLLQQFARSEVAYVEATLAGAVAG